MNKALNYGYALLLNRVWTAVHRAGLEPSLGLLHSGRRRSAGLIFDLMEPFRQPVVDKTVLALVGRRAGLTLNERGELTVRTRRILHKAFARRLIGGPGGEHGRLLTHLQRTATAYRRSLVDGTPYRAYRMSW